MKKTAVIFLTLLMTFLTAACGGSSDGGKTDGGKVDLGSYPENLDEWSGQNFIDYLTETGVFYDGDGAETWLQNHEDYWPGTPVRECAGWWTDDNSSMAVILILSSDEEDTSEAQLEEWKAAIVESKALPGDYSVITVDHLAGNVAFGYSTILDEEIYEKMDAAYRELVEAVGAKEEF